MSAFIVGVGISTSTDDDPAQQATEAERLGYDFVSASDHPVGEQPTYETWTLLSWIAARTSRIGVASRVLGVPFRRPAMVAKAAETLHRLSGGRLILGLGGGYSDAEIEAVGATALTAGQKVSGMADAIAIVRGAWGEPVPNDAGREHPVAVVQMEPKPAAPIPIWLGTYGPRALAVTGRLADGWIPSLGFAGPEKIPSMLAQIRTASAAAGRPVDSVRAIYNVSVTLEHSSSSDASTLGGSAKDVVEQLRGLAELGFSGFNLMLARPTDVAAIAQEVVPELRVTRNG